MAAVLHPDKLRWRAKTPNTLAAEELLEALDAPLEPLEPLPEPTLSQAEGDALVAEVREARDRGR